MTLLGIVPEWHEQAACRGAGNEQFYPPRGRHSNEVQKVVAAYCDHCPVRAECLEASMANNERWGIWGGLTEYHRKKIRKVRLVACWYCGAMFHPTGGQHYCSPHCYNKNRRP